ncbi:hypothetical protein F0U59_23360 [Archangium gephyra]|nr:hypothetical protein F0U59_23360 [Archangium gephyra]
MNCASMPQEVLELRTQLEQERLARARAEAKLDGFREAATLFLAGRQVEAPPAPCHAPSRPPQRDSVTPTTREERNRALARARKQDERVRKRSVTGQRDGVTPSVTRRKEEKNRSIETLLPPPPSGAEARGTLVLVTANARDSQRERPREHRTTATLPPEVQALRNAWNELAAPHGFAPWGERTSAKLLQDALTALERRPLEEWRKAFSLVPRSNVCRGELSSGQRATIVKLLVGTTRDGYTWAEKLLGGEWTIDPEPRVDQPRPAEATPTAEGTAPPGDTPAVSAWRQMLEALRADGSKSYALTWLLQLRARAVDEGTLVLEAADRFHVDWMRDHYGGLLGRMAEIQGLAGVRFIGPDGEGAS